MGRAGCVRRVGLFLAGAVCPAAWAQIGVQTPTIDPLPPPAPGSQQQVTTDNYQGSVADDKLVPGELQLPLDDAIARGLRHNLGLILITANQISARSTQLTELQQLLPTLNANIRDAVQETDLQAQGLRIPAFPTIIGPYGYQDFRGTLTLNLINVASIRNYLAAKHNFRGSQIALEDARNEVILSVGNAYLLVIADQSRVASITQQVATSKVSFDQAHQQHLAGTSPLLDELRAQVDFQTQQQNLIQAQGTLEKDKLALARVIGLPTAQQFVLTEDAPYKQLDELDPDQAVAAALGTRSDLKNFGEQLRGADYAKGAAKAERYPTVQFTGDFGDIGTNVRKSHVTGDAVGTLYVPIFEEARIRGDEALAEQQLEQKRAQLGNLRGQIAQDVRDSILDITAAEKSVQVAESNRGLAAEALTEAQQRFAAGVSDNLAVSQAQQQSAQANDQYIASLYQHNVAKLNLARAMGVATTNLKQYLGGK